MGSLTSNKSITGDKAGVHAQWAVRSGSYFGTFCRDIDTLCILLVQKWKLQRITSNSSNKPQLDDSTCYPYNLLEDF